MVNFGFLVFEKFFSDTLSLSLLLVNNVETVNQFIYSGVTDPPEVDNLRRRRCQNKCFEICSEVFNDWEKGNCGGGYSIKNLKAVFINELIHMHPPTG